MMVKLRASHWQWETSLRLKTWARFCIQGTCSKPMGAIGTHFTSTCMRFPECVNASFLQKMRREAVGKVVEGPVQSRRVAERNTAEGTTGAVATVHTFILL